MVFDESVHFYGTYRPYQKRVLDNLEEFLENEKVHVVAAPGSGKTILGLELIKRLNEPSLILAPSITIKEQWIDRFAKNFLDDPSKVDLYISRNVREYKPIICITYQAFYSAFLKQENKESIDEIELENENYTDFDLVSAIKKYKIKTICLDECHHLKSEWWRSIEVVLKQLTAISLIALTATPPYDCSKNDWNRYIRLCGPIDDEIFVPELIHDANLCPHQDYIYYSYPTKEEQKTIYKYYANGIKIYTKYKKNPELVEIVKHKDIYSSFPKFRKNLFDNFEYYLAVVLFLIENNVKVNSLIKLFVKKYSLNIKLFQVLLQNVLFDDASSYPLTQLQVSLKKEMASLSVVHNKEISLTHNEKIDKIMSLSLSKMDSIKTIIESEIEATKGDMHCLILTDYIKLTTKHYIGGNKPIDSFGTLPIFEMLRRANLDGVTLCCLSGSICILPDYCAEFLPEFECVKLIDGFVEVKITASNRKALVLSITKLFEDNMFNVLVGTKALLGEGWDSPHINTLIMASFIGSYVLSNQMRGRAIRTNPKDKFKKSNIWHLVCLNPYDSNDSSDFYNLSKRFNSFVGIDLDKRQVSDGIYRTGINKIPANSNQLTLLNEKSLEQASDRNKVQRVWNYCLTNAKQINYLTKITNIPNKRLKNMMAYTNLFAALLALFLNYAAFEFFKNLDNTSLPDAFVFLFSSLYMILSVSLTLVLLHRSASSLTPRLTLLAFGKATLRALKKIDPSFSRDAKVKTFYNKNKQCCIYLTKASTYQQNIFSSCINEIFANPYDARYLLTKPRGWFRLNYYVVPDIFKKNKENVLLFHKQLAFFYGKFSIIFVKNKQSRYDVIKANTFYKLKYSNLEIETRNVLLQNKRTGR